MWVKGKSGATCGGQDQEVAPRSVKGHEGLPAGRPQENPRHSGSDRREVFDSPIRSGTGSEEVTPDELWDAEGDVGVGDRLQDFFTEPFPEFHHPLLVTGRAKMAALTGKGQKILMTAVPTLNASETVVEDAAIKITVDDLEVDPARGLWLLGCPRNRTALPMLCTPGKASYHHRIRTEDSRLIQRQTSDLCARSEVTTCY